MSNRWSNVKRFLQALFGRPIELLRKLHRRWSDPDRRLAKTCETLQRHLANPQDRKKACRTYAKALLLALKCDRSKLAQIVLQFDPLFDEQDIASSAIGRALSFLLEAQPQTSQNLDAAWRLSRRSNELLSMGEVRQQICLQAARVGDRNLLLVYLLERRDEDSLSSVELAQILHRFFERHAFQFIEPWKAFFERFAPDELPQIHQVYAVLDRPVEAAELAEATKDYRSAIRYLTLLSGKEIATRILALSEQLGDGEAISRAHQRIAEGFWQEGNYEDALESFRKAGNLERVSDCYQHLGEFGPAIQCRPVIHPEWVREIWSALENASRSHVDRQNFLAAVRLLKSAAEAWQEKSRIAEAERARHLLSEALRTARAAFHDESQTNGERSATDLFKRWSLVEEAAGNYLEAGLQAEKARDYLAASVLFEKANAFGQALAALESASPMRSLPHKSPVIGAGWRLFYGGFALRTSGETDRAIDLYERAGEFLRAAELRKHQLGEEQILFDPRFQELLAKAGQSEYLAELCAAQAAEPGRSADDKARLWRQIKELAERDLLGQNGSTALLSNFRGLKRSIAASSIGRQGNGRTLPAEKFWQIIPTRSGWIWAPATASRASTTNGREPQKSSSGKDGGKFHRCLRSIAPGGN